MPTSAATVVRVSTAADLLASVPSILGYRPEESLILLCLNERNRVQLAVRLDLPDAGDEAAAIAQISHAEPVQCARRIVAVLVSEHDHTSMLDALANAMLGLSIPLESLHLPAFTAGTRWFVHGTSDTGTLPDPANTVLATHRAADGETIRASRDDIAASLAHDDPAAITRRTAAIDAALTRPLPTADEAAAVVRRALREGHRGALELTDQHIATLAIGLSEPAVRDAAFATAVPPSTDLARAARHLWTQLTRLTPEPERAEPAVLAGYAAYMAGDGATARTALDIARSADPGHVLAGMLLRALDHAVDPTQLAPLAQHDEFGLRDALDEHDDPATTAHTDGAAGTAGTAGHR